MIALVVGLALSAEFLPFGDEFKTNCLGKTAKNSSFLAMMPKQDEQVESLVKKLAQNCDLQLYFSTVSSDNEIYSKIYETFYLGVDANKTFFTVYNPVNRLKYVFDKEPTQSALLQFVREAVSGKLQPYLKSQISASSEEGDSSHVLRLTGNQFVKQVLGSSKEYFLMVQAPWCGHCKKAKPQFQEAAQLMSNNPNIKFAMVDGTKNDLPGVSISGFPTILWFGKDKKKAGGQVYSKERSVYKFIDWIETRTEYQWVEPLYSYEDEKAEGL